MMFQEKSKKGSSSVYKSPIVPPINLHNLKESLSPDDHKKSKSTVLEIIEDDEEVEQ